MSLEDDVIRILNTFFEKNKVDIKFESMVLYRPVLREPPFEHMEVIHEAKRVPSCNPICAVFLIHYGDRRMEYEAKYEDIDGGHQLTSYKLRYCDYFPGEDPTKIEGEFAQPIRFVCLLILSTLTHLASK